MNIKKATLINGISKFSTMLVQIILNAILSRILDSETFGIVAIITVFINFFNILADLGIGSAIIQNKKLTKKDNENLFSFTFYLGIILGIVFFALSFIIAYIYKDSIYIYLSLLIFFVIIFNTLNMVPNALLLKEKRFNLIAVRTVIITLFSGIITTILALNGFGVYTLILNSVISSLFIFLWNYLKSPIKLRLTFKIDTLNKIKSFSLFQFLFSLINYFSRNMDNLLIGAFLGSSLLAYYDKSYKLMLYPITIFSTIITPVLHPFLSEYQNKKNIIYSNYIKILKILSLVGAFISAFCFFNAEEIILIVFGKKWVDCIYCFKILSFSIFVQLLSATTGAIYQSLGDTKRLFKVGFINSLISILLIIVGIYFRNINYVSMMVTIAYNIHFIITFYILMQKLFKGKFIKFISSIFKEMVIYLLLIISTFLFKINYDNIFILFIVKSIYLLFVYIILIIIFKEYKVIKNLIFNKSKGDLL